MPSTAAFCSGVNTLAALALAWGPCTAIMASSGRSVTLDGKVDGVMADPGQILLAGGGVHHQAVEGIGQEVGDEVIDDAAFRIEHAAVEGLAGDGEFGHVVGQQVLQEGFDPLAGQIDDGHVGDIEHACIGAHHMVLFQLGTVVDGHLPTGGSPPSWHPLPGVSDAIQ